VITRLGLSVSLAVSGVVHAYLYIHGYQHIPTIGPAFLVQGSAFCALAVLILVGGPGWLNLVAALGAVGSLIAFALSRTIGLFGFTERGWDPSPSAAVSVAAELLTVALCVLGALGTTRHRSVASTNRLAGGASCGSAGSR
jgi:hypothetical protein